MTSVAPCGGLGEKSPPSCTKRTKTTEPDTVCDFVFTKGPKAYRAETLTISDDVGFCGETETYATCARDNAGMANGKTRNTRRKMLIWT